jgi:hypothetical protein
MKAAVIMASTSSRPNHPAVSLEAFGQEVLARRAAASNPEMPRNAGANRTASKKALLRAIEDAGGKW